jgi:hypothetical protein
MKLSDLVEEHAKTNGFPVDKTLEEAEKIRTVKPDLSEEELAEEAVKRMERIKKDPALLETFKKMDEIIGYAEKASIIGKATKPDPAIMAAVIEAVEKIYVTNVINESKRGNGGQRPLRNSPRPAPKQSSSPKPEDRGMFNSTLSSGFLKARLEDSDKDRIYIDLEGTLEEIDWRESAKGEYALLRLLNAGDQQRILASNPEVLDTLRGQQCGHRIVKLTGVEVSINKNGYLNLRTGKFSKLEVEQPEEQRMGA